jgi:deoxyribodipyrimidine photolyase-related protein
MWHALVSSSVNLGLLDPAELCRRAQAEYDAGRAPLNAVEGFIRQISGWREYVRAVYWHEGPDYPHRNALDAHRPLPGFYYDGHTDMNCLSQAIGQTLELGYAHHIQRLMITGNFALIAGIDPFPVHQWYLEVYVDAYEWVEAPNTVGMALYADGGFLASKPYAAGGAYINRMSDYCRRCRFDPGQSTGPDACPFSTLYWNFIDRHAERFERHPRMAMPYRTWSRFTPDRKAAIRARAVEVLETML